MPGSASGPEAADVPQPPRRVLAIVDDLMLRSRIEAAVSGDTSLHFVRSAADLAGQLESNPDLLVLGLAATRLPWEGLLRSVREQASARDLPIIAFGPHRDLELRRRALEAGATRVLANSAFMRALPELLRGASPDSLVDDEA
jgi:DNA-binding response OmpR family regulator